MCFKEPHPGPLQNTLHTSIGLAPFQMVYGYLLLFFVSSEGEVMVFLDLASAWRQSSVAWCPLEVTLDCISLQGERRRFPSPFYQLRHRVWLATPDFLICVERRT